MDMRTVTAGSRVVRLIQWAYKADQPVLLIGKHGVGKSTLLDQAARVLQVRCVVRDLSMMEPTDLAGIPSIGDDGRTRYAPPSFLPADGCGLLVFEELNRCPPYMQAPCLQLLTCRFLNDYQLPPGWLPAWMILLGVVSAVNFAPSLAMVADLAGAGARSTAMGAFNAAGSLGFLLGPLVGGLAVQWAFAAGMNPRAAYALAFLAGGGLTALAALLAIPPLVRLVKAGRTT